MKIFPISVLRTNSNPQNKVIQKPERQNSLQVKNTIAAVYPKNYYLSFRGEEKSDAIKKLENLIDDFYEKNKDKHTESIGLYLYSVMEDLTISRDINYDFLEMFNDNIKYNPKAFVINEKQLTEVIDKALNFNDNTLCGKDIIKDLKERKEIPQDINVLRNSEDFRNITDKIIEYINNKNEGKSEREKKLGERQFREKYYNVLSKSQYNHPVLTKEVIDDIKAELNKEPYKTFNQKMLKIKAQNQLNAVPTLQQTAESLYEDICQKHINPFDNPKLYNFLVRHDESLDYLLEQLYAYQKWKYDDLFENSGIDKKHKILLVDAGLASRFEEFEDFIKKTKIDTSKIEPFELRKKFSDYLGTETVYRGMYFKDPQEGIKNLQQNGCCSSLFKYQPKDEIISELKYFLYPNPVFENTIRDIMLDKAADPEYGNVFLSVSSEYDIAASVPKKDRNSQCPVVVIKAEMPKLSIIKQQNRFADIMNHAQLKVLYVNGKRYPYATQQDKIEAFVPFFMPTDNAQYTIDTSTDGFSWYDMI